MCQNVLKKVCYQGPKIWSRFGVCVDVGRQLYSLSLKQKRYTLCIYKQHFNKQRQAEIGKKIKQKLSNTLRLNFCLLKIIPSLHPRYHPKIIGDILKTEQNEVCVF